MNEIIDLKLKTITELVAVINPKNKQEVQEEINYQIDTIRMLLRNNCA